jgi:hypothetical protein
MAPSLGFTLFIICRSDILNGILIGMIVALSKLRELLQISLCQVRLSSTDSRLSISIFKWSSSSILSRSLSFEANHGSVPGTELDHVSKYFSPFFIHKAKLRCPDFDLLEVHHDCSESQSSGETFAERIAVLNRQFHFSIKILSISRKTPTFRIDLHRIRPHRENHSKVSAQCHSYSGFKTLDP